MMKVIICGSRGIWLTTETISDIVNQSGFGVTELVCGMARGVDKSGLNWAIDNRIPVVEMPFLSGYGKAGGHIRNQKMVDIAQAWIGVIDGELTTGTRDCYNRAKKKGIPTFLYNIGGL